VSSFLLSAPLWAADQYYIGSRHGIDLFKKPDMHAEILLHLHRMQDVQFIRTKRSWSKIQIIQAEEKITGWVPAGSVRHRYNAATAKNAAPTLFSGFSSWFHRDKPAQGKTAVLGVRGFEDEDRSQTASEPRSKEEMMLQDTQWIEALRVPDSDVAAFVQQGDLNP